ncbi:uncharacterized protein LOC128987064 [Macrosteles quadrilineatus]|uniref:uncharacterized protein LOC128987064 n=1 Tax=Macrosteles quadrilineatus TaxID=74068 RepID=UPI0023E2F7A8|nr:uncharacterized protein LOC128987064 [Macrosteles quadrilineatus]
MEVQGNVSSSEIISGINLTSWTQNGVLKSGRQQNISGVWSVQGPVELKGPVSGRGRLADVDLQQLTDNITSSLLDIHAEMKSNLTGACDEANAQLASARGQHCKLLYLDTTQTFSVPSGPSLVTHFKSGDEDYLAVSEKSCTTTIYKWNRNTGTFVTLNREMFGHSLKSFIILNYEQITYVLTESSEISADCNHPGLNLWIFMRDHFKHVTNVNFFSGDLFQGEGNTLYIANSVGMFKYEMHFDNTEGKAYFTSSPHRWNITADVPKAWAGAVHYQWLSGVYEFSNCSGQVISISADPASQFVAMASTEPAEVPRHADYIKVYRQGGRLFDKLPALRVAQLQWLSVPGQTWLMALQNHSTLNLYQLQGPLLGFQPQMSMQTDAKIVTSVALPLASKVNLQPYILIQSLAYVRVVRAFIQALFRCESNRPTTYTADGHQGCLDGAIVRVPWCVECILTSQQALNSIRGWIKSYV